MNGYKKGQVTLAEYVVIFSVVVGVMTAMSLFVRRAIQARVYDAQMGTKEMIEDRTKGSAYVGNYYVQYEPYYVNSRSDVKAGSTATESFSTSGISYGFSRRSSVVTNSAIKSIADME